MKTLRSRYIVISVAAFAVLISAVFAGMAFAANATPAPRLPMVPTVTPLAGDLITSPAIQNGPRLTLRRPDTPSAITQQEALDAIAATGVDWPVTGLFAGEKVTVAAVYGLGTLGNSGPHLTANGQPSAGGCMDWFGPCNIPVQKCVRGAGCTATGAVIGHVDNRPLWIIDVGNVAFYGSHTTANHAVYAVDVATKTVVSIWSYNGP